MATGDQLTLRDAHGAVHQHPERLSRCKPLVVSRINEYPEALVRYRAVGGQLAAQHACRRPTAYPSNSSRAPRCGKDREEEAESRCTSGGYHSGLAREHQNWFEKGQ